MKEIGGYFELETHLGLHYHVKALKLNSARNCLEYILRARQYKKIYVPYYTCEVILEPINKLEIEYEFYCLDNDLTPIFEKKILEDEVFLYTNYFGIKQETVENLSLKIRNLIVDNSQSFFSDPIKDVDTFYSPRKFVGVPDGGYLYTNSVIESTLEHDISFARMSHLLRRIDESAELGYVNFLENDRSLNNMEIKKMSKLTNKLLQGVDYNQIKEKRIKNFLYLKDKLDGINELKISLDENYVPMVYPLLYKDITLRSSLIREKIYVATYWNNVLKWCDEDSFESYLTNYLIPLPIDHRYSIDDMQHIVSVLLELI